MNQKKTIKKQEEASTVDSNSRSSHKISVRLSLGEGPLSSRADNEGVDEIVFSDCLSFEQSNLIYF